MKKILLLSFFALSCTSVKKDVNKSYNDQTPKGAYNLASYYAEGGRFEEAIAQLNNLRNKFPYSQYTTDAELKIADINMKREFYPEAEAAYKVFYSLHPNHPKTDYVLYQTGISYAKQLPSTVDRDLKLANNGLFYFKKVINEFPNSNYTVKAKNQIVQINKKRAEKENYIGNFYYIRGKYGSALLRYEKLISKYQSSGLEKIALYRASTSAFRTKKYDKARQYYQLLAKHFPDSSEKQKCEKELSHGPN